MSIGDDSALCRTSDGYRCERHIRRLAGGERDGVGIRFVVGCGLAGVRTDSRGSGPLVAGRSLKFKMQDSKCKIEFQMEHRLGARFHDAQRFGPAHFCVPFLSWPRVASIPPSRSHGSGHATCGSVVVESGQDVRDRSFRYACKVARFTLGVTRTGTRPITDQLLKSATSVGANLEEAQAASSRREFVRYVDIALREARESAYWLRICVSLEVEPTAEVQRLRDEGDQIARILGAIVVKTKARGL